MPPSYKVQLLQTNAARMVFKRFIPRFTMVLGGGITVCIIISVNLLAKILTTPRVNNRYIPSSVKGFKIRHEIIQPQHRINNINVPLEVKRYAYTHNSKLEEKKPSYKTQFILNNLKTSSFSNFVTSILNIRKAERGKTETPLVEHAKNTAELGRTNAIQPQTTNASIVKHLLNINVSKADHVIGEVTKTTLGETARPGLIKAPKRTVKKPRWYEGPRYIRKMASKVQSIPLSYFHHKNSFKNTLCAYHPSFYYLHFNNGVWQHFQSKDGTSFYMFGAYYDDRRILKQPVVRLLAMVNRIHPSNVTCQLWNSRNSPQMEYVTALRHIFIWKKEWGNFIDGLLHPVMITCPLKNRNGTKKIRGIVPESLSLVNSPCEMATNNLRIFNYRYGKKESFAVCVKGLNFPHDDISVRLVEWVELLKIFGANKIFFYDLAIHENVSKVLDYYVRTGFAERIHITLPGMQLNNFDLLPTFFALRSTTKRQNELIPYNDCFYKNIHRYKYITLLDTDEVIVPLTTDNWSDLMKIVLEEARIERNDSRSSYAASNAYFFDDALHVHGWEPDIPKYMHMLQHIWRATKLSTKGDFAKSFFNTKRVLTLHNHEPLSCLNKRCLPYLISTHLAQLQHYRKDCHYRATCDQLYKNNTMVDNSLWRFKQPLVRRTKTVLRTLGFL